VAILVISQIDNFMDLTVQSEDRPKLHTLYYPSSMKGTDFLTLWKRYILDDRTHLVESENNEAEEVIEG
jgi:hypothetical protein